MNIKNIKNIKTNIKTNIVSDIISLSVIGFNIFAVFMIYYFDFDFIIGLGSVLYLQWGIKKLTTNSSISLFKRPGGAHDCGLFNDGGLVENNSGFPSGHMGSTSFMTNLIYFKFCKNKNIGNYIKYNIWNIFMAYARYTKKCHNPLQIIAGYILGLCIAYLFYYKKNIYNKLLFIKNNIKNEL